MGFATMKNNLIILFLICSLSAFAQPTLQDTTRISVFDPAKSWVTNLSAVRTHSLGNGFTAFTGPTTSTKTFTLPNASATILTSNAAVTVPQGGTGGTTFSGLLQGNGTGAFSAITNSSTVGQVLRVTATNTYGWGALDLSDGDAVTGSLPYANGGRDVVTGRSTGQTAAVASVATLTVGSSDATYAVSGNILVTTSGSESFSLVVDYTDEGNTARSVTIPILRIATSGFTNATISASGAVPYPSSTLEIRCKASTSITIKTSGTFTGCTYNVQGTIAKI